MIQQRHRDEATRKHAILATECKASRNERSAFFSRTMNYEEWQAASKQAEIAMAATDAAKAMEVSHD